MKKPNFFRVGITLLILTLLWVFVYHVAYPRYRAAQTKKAWWDHMWEQRQMQDEWDKNNAR